MKRSSSRKSPLFFAVLLGAGVVTLPAFAQDGPAPSPAGNPANPPETSAPSVSEAPGNAPPAASPAPVQDSTANPGSASAAPAPIFTAVEPQSAAQAQSDAPAEAPDDGKLGHHQDHFLGFLGARVGKVSSSGFDPFSDSDELAQFSVGLGKTIMTAGNFSVAGLFLYDIGGHSAEARGAESDLTVHRLTLGGEARYHFIRQLFVFGRVAPGAIHSIAKIEDTSAGTQTLAARHWVFATDLSAGAMFELTGFSRSQARRPSIWFTVDGGYGFAGESDLTLTADGDGGPERAEPVELGSLALGGPFMRFAAVVTY